ncbi:MAG: hypothetical protein GF341_05640, partial [candidate division Zixibacteria bacterium]|nr:hypothetical protein [candidate division Zixibacteria bacterium]
LSRSPGFNVSDRDDLEQEMSLYLLTRAEQFDPQRASLNTFIALTVHCSAAMLVRKRRRRKRCPEVGMQSLERTMVKTPDGETIPLALGFVRLRQSVRRRRYVRTASVRCRRSVRYWSRVSNPSHRHLAFVASAARDGGCRFGGGDDGHPSRRSACVLPGSIAHVATVALAERGADRRPDRRGGLAVAGPRARGRGAGALARPIAAVLRADATRPPGGQPGADLDPAEHRHPDHRPPGDRMVAFGATITGCPSCPGSLPR